MRKLLRNGAAILFVLSCVAFVGLLTYQFLMLSDLQQASGAGRYQGQLPPTWISLIGALSGAISAAAIPFFGACVIDRVDRFFTQREAAK
jgi:hypothetical protein